MGETFFRKEFARTLELIADGGADVFYSDDMAKAMVRAVQATGGCMTLEDLSGIAHFFGVGPDADRWGAFQVINPDGSQR